MRCVVIVVHVVTVLVVTWGCEAFSVLVEVVCDDATLVVEGFLITVLAEIGTWDRSSRYDRKRVFTCLRYFRRFGC